MEWSRRLPSWRSFTQRPRIRVQAPDADSVSIPRNADKNRQ
jgi:hypothetical protein